MALTFAFSAQQYYESGQVQKETVQQLRDYLKLKKMPYESDEMLVVFIMACDGELESAKNYARDQYEGRKALPNIFQNRKLSDSFKKQWKAIEMGAIPERTDNGDAVIIFRLQNVAASKFQMDIACKLIVMAIDSVLHDEPVPGFIVLVDLKNVKFMHILTLDMSILTRMMKYCSEGLLNHLNSVHYINGGFILDKLFKIFKMLCSEQMMNLFMYHSTNMDWKDFYKNCIPRRCLPSDYGGCCAPMSEIHANMWKKFEDIQEFFDNEIEHRAQYEQLNKC